MQFDSRRNYENSKQLVGYVPRREATPETYRRVGFMAGLEVHQQLLTKEKLFCHCPAGVYHHHEEYDAELIRHMRPTLSELGVYDGTALMEFRTRKEINYRINNENACTYDVDDTPPFPINREALGIALEISLLSKLNVVGEVHITRKQYLDGSIPAGFQRTAILGVEGELELPHKKIRLIQLSIEEDSCREISDIGHVRVYKTDRLGMPLIETVTYPDCDTPDEIKQACDYIRFLNRSTGLVRTGIGAGRQDVNVSCKGGTRVEIKGVAHTKWIPELTHNEVFRQWALLQIKEKLNNQITDVEGWKADFIFVNGAMLDKIPLVGQAEKVMLVNLPGFEGVLSYFTQPGQSFANEIADRLKVIACLEKPNMQSSEQLYPDVNEIVWDEFRRQMNAGAKDVQLLVWGPEADMKTAFETIEERCQMAFLGVPPETRKSLADGTTLFERVLPGADRMYPDTDSPPIPLPDEYITSLSKKLPREVIDSYKQLKKWDVSEEVYTYLFSKNLFPVIQRMANELEADPKFIALFFGQKVKFAEGHFRGPDPFDYNRIFELFAFLKAREIHHNLAAYMLQEMIEHPKMDFDSILQSIGFKKISKEEIESKLPMLKAKFMDGKQEISKTNMRNWVIGQVRKRALGNVDLSGLSKLI
ncbi:MAG: glutamyl-tRNA(Gln) amidotransferase subunit E [Bacteroidetes bacterium GWF2_41_31]|nr:MAG: glutamyl-tRNA(Gln) amidotransferase subunit E [Bacteroidetes bacterium GWF2_41_31]OFZ05321.1 MAG: glutamyl-tRNA(Gln) amidotransferase subunit E [Bacteroidetes bacterium RIFOXYB12_FULL_41_6]